MARTRVLIAVKTYPVLSQKHIELVCTAGFREDGSWIRIYPSPFRFLEDNQRYRKYQWIELDLKKNLKDQRPESYSPTNIDTIQLGEVISTDRSWEERKNFILGNNPVYSSLDEVIDGAKSNTFSFAILKPAKIIDFKAIAVDREWDVSRKQAAEASLNQGSLFQENDHSDFKLVKKLPYKFSYHFVDGHGRESTMMIEDWEIGQLYWNCLKNGDEKAAIAKVKEKYFDDIALTKDVYLFLGTTLKFHNMNAPNPYVIIGVFYPPFIKQADLFE